MDSPNWPRKGTVKRYRNGVVLGREAPAREADSSDDPSEPPAALQTGRVGTRSFIAVRLHLVGFAGPVPSWLIGTPAFQQCLLQTGGILVALRRVFLQAARDDRAQVSRYLRAKV